MAPWQRLLRDTLIQASLAWERLESGVTFNPLSERARRNPYPMYRRLREKDPVHKSRLVNGWVVSRYADAALVVQDHRQFSNDDSKALRGPLVAGGRVSETHSMVGIDPPEHTRIRGLVAKAFSPGAIQSLRPTIEAIAVRLLDGVGDKGRFDIVESLTKPMPLLVMAKILGLPESDLEQMGSWAEDVEQLLVPKAATRPLRLLRQSRDELVAYVNRAAADRRGQPSADLIGDLVAAKEQGLLSSDELTVTLVFVLGAGTLTTSALMGNALVRLLSHPAELQSIRRDASLLPIFIEEVLRLDTAVQFDRRIALQDVKLGAKRIRKGDHIILLMGSFGHDPHAFADSEQLSFERRFPNHLSFGKGIHYCIGALLASAEVAIALRVLLERFDEIQMECDPTYGDILMIRGPKSLLLKARARERSD